ncbi:MAG TPA: DUF87 domain-containing protein, partial [Promineifilum sp.]|nr:DUF87 domain-containing protein [Promineifilum sp.]
MTEPITPGTEFGRVISVRGSQARIGMVPSRNVGVVEARATVGRFVSIRSAHSIIIAMLTEVSCENLSALDREQYIATASVDLLGEIITMPSGNPRFQRGVTIYPAIGDIAATITNQDLRVVYAPSQKDAINVGNLQQDPSVIAYVDVDEMLSKHFAVLGSTGVG